MANLVNSVNLICRSEAQAAYYALFGFVCLTCGCICEWIRGTGLQQEISWPRLKLVHMEGVHGTQLSLQEPNIEANLHNSHTRYWMWGYSTDRRTFLTDMELSSDIIYRLNTPKAEFKRFSGHKSKRREFKRLAISSIFLIINSFCY